MDVPTFTFNADSFSALYAQISQALACFDAATPASFAGKDDIPITVDAPGMWHFELNGLSYLQEFVLPNL